MSWWMRPCIPCPDAMWWAPPRWPETRKKKTKTKTGDRSRPSARIAKCLLRHQHAVDHVDDAVALAHVGGGDLGGAALGVGQGDAAVAVRGGGQRGALHGGQ